MPVGGIARSAGKAHRPVRSCEARTMEPGRWALAFSME